MATARQPDVQQNRTIVSRIIIGDDEELHVVIKSPTLDGQPAGTYGEISDFMLRSPEAGFWDYVHGVDIDLKRIEELIAGLEKLREAAAPYLSQVAS